ncbi:MAG: MoaD/ThiS family protein [Candidatus Latescibacteria bacterium]|nr:MoaD/ThiS family protein [Candidatus Latescibacterota bacterium]
MPMTVSVKLFATLTKYLPAGSMKKTTMLTLDDGATTDDLVVKLGIPDGHVHLTLVDGKHVPKGAPLHDGAVVSLFPPIAGGESRD